MGEDAGHGHDCTVAGADHAWKEGFKGIERTHHVHLERFFDFVEGEIEEGFTVHYCGVVD